MKIRHEGPKIDTLEALQAIYYYSCRNETNNK